MNSFTEAYFNYGYNTTIEKIAAKKKEDTEMGLGAKLGLGAAGVGAAGAGAYYSPEILRFLAEQGREHLPPGQFSDSAIQALGSGSDWAQHNLQEPMLQAGREAAAYGGQALDSAKEYGSKAMDYGSAKLEEAKKFIMEQMGKGPSASQTPGYLEHFKNKQQTLS